MRGLALLALCAATLVAADVRVGVFVLFKPRRLEVRQSGGPWTAVEEGYHLPLGDFELRVPGKIERRFQGALDVAAQDGHLEAIVTMPLETAVASIVASESPPGAPLEALKAQAIVARSFLLANPRRHGAFDACDTTHCQFLRQPPGPTQLAAVAADATQGMTLEYEGRVVPALYSAQCGGRTRSLADAGWGPGAYPFFAVECPSCRGRRVEGHRIGMCQRGAAAMARDGGRYDAILRRYFPAATVASTR